jgi:hypothetical protein
VAPSEQLIATVRSPFVHTLATAGEPDPAVGVWLQVPGASWKVEPFAAPTLLKVTVWVDEPPGTRGVPVPPYLLIVVHVQELVALSLELQVDVPLVSRRITALPVATVLLLLEITALVHDESVPLAPRTSTTAATAHEPHTSTTGLRRP